MVLLSTLTQEIRDGLWGLTVPQVDAVWLNAKNVVSHSI